MYAFRRSADAVNLMHESWHRSACDHCFGIVRWDLRLQLQREEKTCPQFVAESCVPPITLIFVVLSDNAKEMFPILLPGSFSPNDPGKIMEFWKIIKGEIAWPLQLSHLNQTFLVVSNNGYGIDKVVLAKCFSWWIWLCFQAISFCLSTIFLLVVSTILRYYNFCLCMCIDLFAVQLRTVLKTVRVVPVADWNHSEVGDCCDLCNVGILSVFSWTSSNDIEQV